MPAGPGDSNFVSKATALLDQAEDELLSDESVGDAFEQNAEEVHANLASPETKALASSKDDDTGLFESAFPHTSTGSAGDSNASGVIFDPWPVDLSTLYPGNDVARSAQESLAGDCIASTSGMKVRELMASTDDLPGHDSTASTITSNNDSEAGADTCLLYTSPSPRD